ncbi:MAG TPA: phosphatidylserine decarboxylase [Candidatus Pacearchaeota archaeon]|nr:phosphatidylserine decarboxylase [Candidatus Pacearchaeota archaeon]
MKIETKNTISGRLFDLIKLNNKFHKYESIKINNKSLIISPVEAKVKYIGKIDNNGIIISKNNKKINIKELIGEYSKYFKGGSYINFYLKPNNKHFWVTPASGKFIYTQKNQGNSKIPVLIGLENLLGIEMFSKAVKKNASISSIFQTKNNLIAMIAVGSLNVNRIHVNYKQGINYKKGHPCGYFSLGSSMLLCFQKNKNFLVNEGDAVKIGEKIL